MYTDYALGRFFAEASKQPWFANTIFLITADHCASSAGRTEIPLEKYHIPALIYAPGFVEPQHVGGIVSQIDLMPTLLSLLNMSYDSHFYGRSIFDDGICQPRVHRNLPGPGLPRRRHLHDPVARAPLRTVPGRSHGGQSPQPRTDGNGKPRTGLARHRLLPDFERVEQTLSAGI